MGHNLRVCISSGLFVHKLGVRLRRGFCSSELRICALSGIRLFRFLFLFVQEIWTNKSYGVSFNACTLGVKFSYSLTLLFFFVNAAFSGLIPQVCSSCFSCWLLTLF